jgi:hypothetical protein
MKACDSCNTCRVDIGKSYEDYSTLRRFLGILVIYLPLLTFPFVILSAYMTYFHLWVLGAKNLKKWGDFIPDRASHRYNLKNQIVMDAAFFGSMTHSKLFWIANCTWYCPYSVALFEWHAYMVKVVENWWCPFTHEKKEDYKNASIDKSFWHIYPEGVERLHPDDLVNPIWNDENDKKDNT